MKKDNPIWIITIVIIFLLVVLNIVFSTKINEIKDYQINSSNQEVNISKKINLPTTCPDSSGGNSGSYLRIKYFYSDYCPWCRKEEPILKELVAADGNLVYIEWINIDSCHNETVKYNVGGVPTFVFSTSDGEKEYSHYGFIYKKDLRKLICDVTGGC
jgi:thiol-disulfide isomerase/thioredoxin